MDTPDSLCLFNLWIPMQKKRNQKEFSLVAEVVAARKSSQGCNDGSVLGMSSSSFSKHDWGSSIGLYCLVAWFSSLPGDHGEPQYPSCKFLVCSNSWGKFLKLEILVYRSPSKSFPKLFRAQVKFHHLCEIFVLYF